MQNAKIWPSSNGYDLLESYTTALYGERGAFRHNLERYLHSAEFLNACRSPSSIENVPELSFRDIKQQIEREEYFKVLCNHVLEVYASREKEEVLTQDDYNEMAGIMGLCPGQCDWHETLFPHLVDLFVSSSEEGNEILKNVAGSPNIVKIMVTTMSDGLRSGQIINYLGRNLWSQGYARNYFRGENAYNAQTRPSLFRNMPTDHEKAEVHKVIGNLRMIEFSLWLCTLSFVQNWPYGDVFHGAIAQHYGIPTNGIDITSDIKTALFFACCRYEAGKWRPLHPLEYEEINSRPDVAKRGGDSRFGMIFCAPADVANMSRTANISDLRVTGITPIGFQPFMRCSSQSGYIIEAGEPYDLYKDRSFSKFKFRHTPEICEWIFAEMDEGKKVYPQEMFGNCEDIVSTIKSQTKFSQDAFNLAMRHLELEGRAGEFLERLKLQGIQIVPSVVICSEERKAEIERNYWEAFQQYIYSSSPTSVRVQFAL